MIFLPSVYLTEPVMLRPTSRQFPFDEVCTQIVQALEERNWEIPGLEVTFRTYGSGSAVFRMLDNVVGKDFVLHFGRNQGLNHGWFDSAAVERIVILKQDLTVYEDEGVSFQKYVGKNWKRDQQRFFEGNYRFNRSIDGDFVTYEGGCDCGRGTSIHHWHQGQRKPILIPKQLDGVVLHTVIRTDDLHQEFAAWLKENVLEFIESHPLAVPNFGRFDIENIPFPSSLPPLYAFAKFDDAYRIREGKTDANEVLEKNRYALEPVRGWAALGARDDTTPIPEVAYEGFIWCGFGEVTPESALKDLAIPGHFSHDEAFVCRVTPTRANDIYIGDHAAYMRKREELMANIGDRSSFTDREVNAMEAARGHTIVPITDYAGGFEQPVVLIGRELGFDEVEIVSVPKEGWAKNNWEAALR